jgi:hypothetical protein
MSCKYHLMIPVHAPFTISGGERPPYGPTGGCWTSAVDARLDILPHGEHMLGMLEWREYACPTVNNPSFSVQSLTRTPLACMHISLLARRPSGLV